MKKRTPGAWQKYLDKLASEAVRLRGRCERCGRTTTLQTSHIYSRSNKELRWELRNLICFCAGCHFWWHQHPIDAISWLIEYKGKKYVDELRVSSRITRQWFKDDYKRIENELLLNLSSGMVELRDGKEV